MRFPKRLLIAVLALASVAACSNGASPSAPAARSAAASSPYLSDLYQKAQDAGQTEIVNYNAFPPAIQPVFDAFEEDFPGMTVKSVATAGAPMQARLQAEASSGSPQADLVFMGISDVNALKDKGLFEPFTPENAAMLPAEYRGPGDMWLSPQAQASVVPVNATKVSEADAPKTWQDLTDPRWRGQMGSGDLGASTSGTVTALSILYLKGIIDDNWLRAAAANNPTIYPSTGAVIQGVATGQSSMALPQGNPSAYAAEKQGAPIRRLVMAEGLPTFGLPVAITKDCPHREAAQLLQAYLFTERAQQLIAEAGALPTMPGAPLPAGLEGAKFQVLSADQADNQLQPTLEKVSQAFSRRS